MSQVTTASRRQFVKGVLGGAAALVLGFDPVHRTWVTSALADGRGASRSPISTACW